MPDPDPTPTPDPVPDPAPAPDPKPDPPKTFTQAELDKIVQDRLAREAKKYDGYDDLKTKAAEFDKLQEAQKTELQKAQDRAAELEKKATDAEARAKDTALRAAIISEAAKQNVVDTDAVVALLDKTAIEFDTDGAPTNIAEAMDALLKAKPYLAGGGSRGSADQGARTAAANQVTREQLKTMSQPEIIKAQNEGRLDVVMGRTR